MGSGFQSHTQRQGLISCKFKATIHILGAVYPVLRRLEQNESLLCDGVILQKQNMQLLLLLLFCSRINRKTEIFLFHPYLFTPPSYPIQRESKNTYFLVLWFRGRGGFQSKCVDSTNRPLLRDGWFLTDWKLGKGETMGGREWGRCVCTCAGTQVFWGPWGSETCSHSWTSTSSTKTSGEGWHCKSRVLHLQGQPRADQNYYYCFNSRSFQEAKFEFTTPQKLVT